MREVVVERVLRCVELIPPGRVASYGTVGEICGVGARQVGTIMRLHGEHVPWWRVTSHAGDLGGGLLDRALPHWRSEGIELKPNALGCRYRAYEADVALLEREWRAAVADLPIDESSGR